MVAYFKWEALASSWLSVPDARKSACRLLSAAVTPKIDAAWALGLPEKEVRKLHRQIGLGIRRAVQVLTMHVRHDKVSDFWANPGFLRKLSASVKPDSTAGRQLDKPRREAYLLAAALIGRVLDDNLEDFRKAYIEADSVPQLELDILNAVYAVLLDNGGVAYHLAKWPARIRWLESVGGLNGPLPDEYLSKQFLRRKKQLSHAPDKGGLPWTGPFLTP
jgi:hypothetical protein